MLVTMLTAPTAALGWLEVQIDGCQGKAGGDYSKQRRWMCKALGGGYC